MILDTNQSVFLQRSNPEPNTSNMFCCPRGVSIDIFGQNLGVLILQNCVSQNNEGSLYVQILLLVYTNKKHIPDKKIELVERPKGNIHDAKSKIFL